MRFPTRFHPSPAMVVACLALFVALAGTSVAAVSQLAPRNSVATSSIQDGAVTNVKLRDFAVGRKKLAGNVVNSSKLSAGAVTNPKLQDFAVGRRKLARGAVTSSKVANGSLRAEDFVGGQLPAGPRGPRGRTGRTGRPGPSNAYAASLSGPVKVPAETTTLKTLTIPQGGSYVAFAKAYFSNESSAVITCTLTAQADVDESQASVDENAPSTLALNLAHRFVASGTVTFACSTSAEGPQANQIRISAIRVGELVSSG